MKNGYGLIDGEQRHREAPTTFEMPDADDRRGLEPGSIAKIGVSSSTGTNGERFWVVVTDVKDGKYVGSIDNDLVHTKHHGLKDKDIVEFGPEHVLSFMPPPPAPKV